MGKARDASRCMDWNYGGQVSQRFTVMSMLLLSAAVQTIPFGTALSCMTGIGCRYCGNGYSVFCWTCYFARLFFIAAWSFLLPIKPAENNRICLEKQPQTAEVSAASSVMIILNRATSGALAWRMHACHAVPPCHVSAKDVSFFQQCSGKMTSILEATRPVLCDISRWCKPSEFTTRHSGDSFGSVIASGRTTMKSVTSRHAWLMDNIRLEENECNRIREWQSFHHPFVIVLDIEHLDR